MNLSNPSLGLAGIEYAGKDEIAARFQQMNLTWQVLIDSKTTAQIGYVGQLGQHLVVPQQDMGFRGDSLDQCTRSSTSCMKPAG